MEEKDNVKALYRLSIALNSQEHQLEAWPYIKRAYKQSPNDKAIAGLYSSLKQFKEDHDKKIQKEKEVKKEKSQGDEIKNESKKAKILKSAFKFNKEKEPESPKHDSDEEVKIEEEKVAPQ